jgi:diguanylate cyclase
VLLPATAAEDAVLAVERCLRMLAANPFRFEEDSRILTFSGGAAGWRSRESLDELIKRADETMYAAKRAGKNRVLKADDGDRLPETADR